MRHYVYKTTCLPNGKYYYGVHSEKRKSDGYIGCGVVSDGTAINLKRKGVKSYFIDSVIKYGYKNFKKEIIAFFDNIEDAYEVEELIVDTKEISNTKCMNIRLGGFGGVVPSLCKKTSIIDTYTGEELEFDSISDCAYFLKIKNISTAKRMVNNRYVKKDYVEPVSVKNINNEVFNFVDIYEASRQTGIKINRLREVVTGNRHSSNGYFNIDFNLSFARKSRKQP
jgi:hypothetical protein